MMHIADSPYLESYPSRRVRRRTALAVMTTLAACADPGAAPGSLDGASPPRADVVADPARASGIVPIDLGTLGGMFSAAWAISDAGVIVGTSQLPSGENHMFVRDTNGIMLDAGVPSFARFAYPAAINNDGVVVGVTDQPRTAFRWTRRTGFQRLGGFGGDAWARDVNDRGEIVGFGELVPGAGKQVAALWRPDGSLRLLSDPASPSSYGQAINNAGVVVGGTFDSLGMPRAFRWSASSGMVDLGAPPFANAASDINDRGTVVGDFQPLDGTVRGFRLDEPGRGVDLGFFGDGSYLSPIAIGHDGTIVSIARDGRGGFHSVRQRGSRMMELLPVSGGATVTDVNRCGRSVGFSQVPSGAQHAVLWPGWC